MQQSVSSGNLSFDSSIEMDTDVPFDRKFSDEHVIDAAERAVLRVAGELLCGCRYWTRSSVHHLRRATNSVYDRGGGNW